VDEIDPVRPRSSESLTSQEDEVSPATLDELFTELIDQAGLPGLAWREKVRCWTLSGVERVHFADGGSLIFKYARPPLTGEAYVLANLAACAMPAPKLVAHITRHEVMGMLIEDLGQAIRPATLREAAAAAVTVHAAPPPPGLRALDAEALQQLPGKALSSLDALRSTGRWGDTNDIALRLKAAATLAEDRVVDTELPPYGLCHSEFHPTSLHIGAAGWRLLDWARAFVGPGLLDLASWQNTREPPNLATLRRMLDAYVAAGGAPEAVVPRGGLPPERWAFGWHRLWIVAWYLEQAATWIADPAADPHYQRVIRRHLDEALRCLRSA
jgi:hypothetical protein